MSNVKKFIILLGDVLLLYGSLAITLLLRYRTDQFSGVFNDHIRPFSLIFIFWILIFYLNELYNSRSLNITISTIQRFLFSIFLTAVISITLFYLFTSFFKLTPKTNLFIFTSIFGILDFGWRFILRKAYISGGWRNRILIIGDSPMINNATNHLKDHPQIGYDIIRQIKEISDIKDINQIIKADNINTIIIQPHLKKNPEIVKIIYQLISSQITIIDFITFYEMIFQKIPLEELEESWFIEKIRSRRPLYETYKRILDVLLSFLLLIVLSPLMAIIGILIKITSKGPAIYKQERMGFNNKSFALYKFRSMRADKSGPWALWTVENDARITFIGKIIRRAHLDEFPQLYNILKGDISFIGPRAERKELAELYKQLPYYEMRHIIKPGLTGWAQLNYKPSVSLEEAAEKLKYDIYYIKNRSLTLDFFILLKTIKYLFVSNDKPR